MRIVSCVPSISELVATFDIHQLVGRTRFCSEPDFIRKIPVVGGTKNLNTETIRHLHPDLILAVKEENNKDQIELLMTEFRAEVFEIGDISDALSMINRIGILMNREQKAENLTQQITTGFHGLDFAAKIPALYLIWDNPVMTIGGDTFINEMLSIAGFRNVFGNQNRYPVVDLENDLPEEPRIVILSSEPYPFLEKHLARFQTRFPDSIVALADGSMFSWYGSRMAQFPDYCLNFRRQNGF